MMVLTKLQKELLVHMLKQEDRCGRGASRTMDSLVGRGLAKYTSGYGWKFGGIIELTERGIDTAKKLTDDSRSRGGFTPRTEKTIIKPAVFDGCNE